ncbi:substrate-binding periplasmic protein [Arsukibacterium perlucidum]|uniref:substrate-binding periplasmic protein n=1 Tax=Arsukibacterium perlucidum TaxID=368811 RepID=UPI00039B8A2E|nr:transporter substrate-binding domain-containing protein [Arsukibacterium perlucidum]
MHSGWLSGILLWLTMSLPAMALQAEQPELEWCLDDYPNRHNYPAQGSPYGPTVDFMQELAKRASIRIRYSPSIPFARCLRLMEQGKTDLMVRLKTDAERERFMFMLPLQESPPEILVIHTDSPDIKNTSELKRLNVMFIRGYTYQGNTINIIANHPRSIIIDSIDVGLQMLLKGRGDAIVTTEEYINRQIQSKSEYRDQFKLASLPLHDAEQNFFIYLALSKASPHAHLKERLEQAIASMIADDLMDLYGDN